MACRQVREASRGTNRRGSRGARAGILLADRSESRRISLDTGTWSQSNADSGEPREVPDAEVNLHLGNRG
jgi:hypothetical protein